MKNYFNFLSFALGANKLNKMNKRKKSIYLLAVILVSVVQAVFANTKGIERKELFNSDWRFYRGSAQNAQQPVYDDAAWRSVNLPHDWSIEFLPNQEPDKVVGPFSRESIGGAATGQTVGGEGWYRKDFVIDTKDADKRHELYFEGIYNQAEIWVNGQRAYFNAYGYSTFRVDITPYCLPAGQKNVVAVRVLNEGQNSRWYTGSGIYRHVWLIRTEPSFIDDWGTFIHTKSIDDNKASVSLSTTIVNGDVQDKAYTLKIRLLSPNGKQVAFTSNQLDIAAKDTAEATMDLVVKNPLLWSVDDPQLYKICVEMLDKDKKMDEFVRPFGIRTIRFSVDKGFELNGVQMKLKGGCVHHDNGLLGAASFDRAEERKIKLLKQQGFNAVRVSHNPMSEGFMDACDRLGMLVINEAFDQWENQKNPHDYHLYFKEWSAKDIRALILRDRNRPSVIMWSIGNEIRERIAEKGKKTAEYLRNEVLKYDTTRPITAGVNKYWNKERTAMIPLDNAFYHLDIAGYNYMWRFYEEEAARFPERIMYGSESVAMEAAQNWDKVEKYNYVLGDFVWTAVDYLGESGIGNSIEVDPEENVHQFMQWPWFNGWCGDLDLIGTKKPQSYYRDVVWRQRPISMAVERPIADGKIRKVSFWGWTDELLSWTFPGMENKKMTVNVYTRAPKVRLYLNSELIAEDTTSTLYKARFAVPYQAGELRAVEVIDGKEQNAVRLVTTGPAYQVRLVADRTKLTADGQDLAFVKVQLVDAKGNLVLDSDRKVQLDLDGKEIVVEGVGSASPTDMASFGSMNPKLFRGEAMVILRPGLQQGNVRLSVSTAGLKGDSINISSN